MHDEVGELAGTLNAMLASLERAREAEHRFVGDASHELRTPLTALRGNAAYVARHGADPAVLADIEADAARLASCSTTCSRWPARTPPRPRRASPSTWPSWPASCRRRRAWSQPRGSSVRGERDALERALGNLVANARTPRPAARSPSRCAPATAGAARPSPTRARARRRRGRRAFERFWRGAGARGEGSGLGLAIVRAIAERHGGYVDGRRRAFTTALSETLKLRAVQPRHMRRLRDRLHPTHLRPRRRGRRRWRAGAGIAQARSAAAPSPPAKPLDRAVHDAASAPAGRRRHRARIHFTNNLLPSGSLPEGTASPLITGADGRLWLAGDGRFRLELQSDAGDAQIVGDGKRFSVYDAASNTAYTGDARRSAGRRRREAGAAAPTLAGIDEGLANLGKMWTLSGADAAHDRRPAEPTPCASRRRTTAACSAPPRSPGTPPAACRCAPPSTPRARPTPVLELEATHISYGPIAAAT